MTSDEERVAYLSGEDAGSLNAEERSDLDGLRALLADRSTWVEPDAFLEDRVVSAISRRPAELEGSTPRSGVQSRRRVIISAAAVAAVVGLAVGLVLSFNGGTKSGGRFTAALVPTYLAPGASGSATLTQTNAGWEVVLRTSGLPRLDNGRYYEAWLKDPAGRLVPIGTFNQGPRVTLWAGVSPQNFPTLTITEQLANGNPASSGMKVLVGRADVPAVRSP